LAGSIDEVLPVAFLISPERLFSGAGGIAAAIAIGASVAQVFSVLGSASDQERRLRTALGGLFGLAMMIGLILLSASGR
jgi:hypothetical protein